MFKFKRQIRSYGVAIGSVIFAFLLTLALDPFVELTKASFLLFFGAITVSAWYGGRGPGIVATLLSALCAWYFFLEPVRSLNLTVASSVRMLLFLFQGGLISVLVGSLRRAQRQTKESLHQLEASEAKFRRLVNSNIIGVVSSNIHGAITEANDVFLNSLGYSRKDLLAGQLRWDEMTPPDLREQDGPALQELLEKGINTPYEKALIGKQGQRVPVVMGAALLEDDPEQVISFILDISEHNQTENALRASEERLRESKERFRILAEQVQVIPWEVDPATGQFTYVGPQAVEILGYPLEDWYADGFWIDHIYEPDREWVPKFCYERSLSLDNYDFEYRMVTAEGQVVWLYDVVNVVRQGNEPKLLCGVMIDITERKRQEAAQQYLAEVSKVLASSLDYQTTLNQLAQQMVPHLADWCVVPG